MLIFVIFLPERYGPRIKEWFFESKIINDFWKKKKEILPPYTLKNLFTKNNFAKFEKDQTLVSCFRPGEKLLTNFLLLARKSTEKPEKIALRNLRKKERWKKTLKKSERH